MKKVRRDERSHVSSSCQVAVLCVILLEVWLQNTLPWSGCWVAKQSQKYSLNSANQGMEYFEGPAADVLGEGNVPIDSREVLALC